MSTDGDIKDRSCRSIVTVRGIGGGGMGAGKPPTDGETGYEPSQLAGLQVVKDAALQLAELR